jgi:hypothetical protein
MKFRLTRDWSLGNVTAPAGTVFDFANSKQKAQAQGRIPFDAVPLDDEAAAAQAAAYPDHKHLLSGAWI